MNAVLDHSRDEAPLCARELTLTWSEGPAGTVLKRLNLSVPAGAVLGLLGRNGAGKTTLIETLLGLLVPTGGSAWVFGEPALGMSDAAKRRLSFVPQDPDAFSWMQVGDMLAFIGSYYPRWDRAYAERALGESGISPQRVLSMLSPGERQRVALIRALAARPALLVLDEPASALDPVARRELLREIAARAGEEGMTVLFSTQIVSDLQRVASHVCLLHAGRFVLNAPVDELAERCVRVIVPASLAAALPPAPMDGELARHARPGGTALVIRREPGDRWGAWLERPGMRVEPLDLEELFIEVTT